MKLHKIRNVPLNVCAAEQVIASNIAFKLHINFGDAFKAFLAEGPARGAIDIEVGRLVKFGMDSFKRTASKKYDIDGVYLALSHGLEQYLTHFTVFFDYTSVGKAFPIY